VLIPKAENIFKTVTANRSKGAPKLIAVQRQKRRLSLESVEKRNLPRVVGAAEDRVHVPAPVTRLVINSALLTVNENLYSPHVVVRYNKIVMEQKTKTTMATQCQY